MSKRYYRPVDPTPNDLSYNFSQSSKFRKTDESSAEDQGDDEPENDEDGNVEG